MMQALDPRSSERDTPSHAVIWAVTELRRQGFPLRTAIDVGCGRGRNTLYLAQQGMQVTALDIMPNAIAALQDEATRQGLQSQIRALTQDATEPWPVAPDSADLIIDCFCFKHITGKDFRASYKDALLRVLRSHGHYLLSFASIGDGYYGQYLPVDADMAMRLGTAVVMDPARNAESVLFTPGHVQDFFQPQLSLLAELKQDKPMMKHGKLFERETYALLLRRQPHHFAA